MKINKAVRITTLIALGMFSINGIALAEEQPEKSDKESCEQEAKESGLMDNEFQEFVTQCLEDIRAQKDADPKAGSES